MDKFSELDLDSIEFQKPDWWLKVERDTFSKITSNIGGEYGSLASTSSSIIEASIQCCVLNTVIDHIREDWKPLITREASPKKPRTYFHPNIPEIWKLPSTYSLKPRYWHEKPLEIYITYPYMITTADDILPVREELPERKRYQYDDYFQHIKMLVKKASVDMDNEDDQDAFGMLKIEHTGEKVQTAKVVDKIKDEVVNLEPAKRYVKVADAPVNKAQTFKKITIKKEGQKLPSFKGLVSKDNNNNAKDPY